MTAATAILVHSSGLAGRQWRRLAAALTERGLRVLTPDLTGHGSGPPWPDGMPFSFEEDVRSLSALLEAEGPAFLVGHSYGGFLALQAAMRAPAKVSRLVLFDPVAFGVLDPVGDAEERALLVRLQEKWDGAGTDSEHWLEDFVDFWQGQGAWGQLKDEARAGFRKPYWVMREGVRTLMTDVTPVAAYRGLTMPTRLLTGELTPAPAQKVGLRLSEGLPDATLTSVPGAGHMAPLTHPDAVNAFILQALR